MKQHNKVILVTGGAGYIGSHVCKVLFQAGYIPVSYDNLVYGHSWAAKWGPLEIGDIADRRKLDDVIRKYEPEAVMHFAAYAYVNESVENPAKYYRNNVIGTINLLEAMYEHGLNNIIFSSTCATYGVPESIPVKENHPQNPINPYGASKLMIERIIQDFGAAYGINFIILRYFNAAGADPDSEIGEDHDPEPHLIPLALEAASGVNPFITIYGHDYDTPDGTCIRDYIHVTDLAYAHLLAADAILNGNVSNKAYNLGNEKGFSVKNIIETVENIVGQKITVKKGPPRPGDPPCLIGDSAKIKRELGWKPNYQDISEIIGTAWQWIRKHKLQVKTVC